MKKRLNDNWTFCKFPLDTPIETLFQNMSWTPVDLPHDWMIYDTENLYEQAISCYRRIINKKQLLDKPVSRTGISNPVNESNTCSQKRKIGRASCRERV